MTNYAVLIGNSQFTPEAELGALTSPPQDVTGLAAELKAEGRGLFTDITLLVNKSSGEIKRSLIKILKAAGKDDLVLLYYSGHGLPNNKNNDLYLATADTEADYLEATAVSFEEIYRWISRHYCKKVVILLDCCYSGTAGQVFKGDLSSQLQTLNDKVMGTCLIAAASNDQVALDRAEGGYSLFTKHLIEGLRGAADRDSSGLVTLGELFHYVREKVTADNPTQVPKRFLKDENGELILAKSGRDSRKERADKIRPYLYDLAKEDRITHEILNEAMRIIAKAKLDLSELETAQDALISNCYANKDALNFVRLWDRLELLPPSAKPVQVETPPPKTPQPTHRIVDPKPKPVPEQSVESPNVSKLPIQKILAFAAVGVLVLVAMLWFSPDSTQVGTTVIETPVVPVVDEAKVKEAKRLAAIQHAKEVLNGDDEKQWQTAAQQLASGEFAPLDSEAMRLLGLSYEMGILGEAKNYAQACPWYLQSAQAGNQKAMIQLQKLSKECKK
ncbi:MAG: caspase family protein [Gallionella sp.]|nr:caspase family protein [Gallionella sp.]